MQHKKSRSRSKPVKAQKAQMRTLLNLNNLDEQIEREGSSSSESHTKSTKTKGKDAEATRKPHVASDVNVNAVPVPVPEDDLSTPDEVESALTVHTGVLPAMPSTTGVAIVTPGFSPLPPFASLAATMTVSTISSISASALMTSASPLNADEKQPQVQSQAPKHVSTVITVLVVVGIACLAIVAFILTKACKGPRKRAFPTPSLPILQDAFSDRDAKDDEESLFGGKERNSGRPGSNGLWPWTLYPQPNPAFAQPVVSNINQPSSQTVQAPTHKLSEERLCPPSDGNVTRKSPPSYPAQETSVSITRPAKRVSVMSMSVYPGSPQSTQGGVGMAIGGVSPLTADGMPVLQRSVSKASARRFSRSRRSVRYSMHEAHERDGNMDVYDGLQTTSPGTPAAALHKKSGSLQGRARVKAPYAPGTLLRASSTVGDFSASSNPFDDPQYVLPPLLPTVKSDALRERDTRALTTALGLASPIPTSPQPTIYPDDSITLAGDRRNTRTANKPRPQSQSLSPGTEASARLGNLMLAEFSSMNSLPSIHTTAAVANEGSSGVSRNKSARKRTGDKPPRVPSPPPLPSLAQMAMESANPDAYASYRSPTYSIYGLYEADRKSRAPGEGGY